MRQTTKNLVSIVAKTLPVSEPIFEFGSMKVPGQETLADLRQLFPNMKYVGCDMREGLGVDMILNLHNIELPSESVGTVICLDTLEHVEYPYKAMEEIHRIIRPNGFVIITSVMNFPIHDYPYDYWRFTPEAFRSLLKHFDSSFVGFAGEESFPHTIIGIGFKGNQPPMYNFIKEYEKWKNKQKYSMLDISLRITPPVLLPFVSKIGRLILGKNKY
jgi:SAM-dependent methyltransferase